VNLDYMNFNVAPLQVIVLYCIALLCIGGRKVKTGQLERNEPWLMWLVLT